MCHSPRRYALEGAVLSRCFEHGQDVVRRRVGLQAVAGGHYEGGFVSGKRHDHVTLALQMLLQARPLVGRRLG